MHVRSVDHVSVPPEKIERLGSFAVVAPIALGTLTAVYRARRASRQGGSSSVEASNAQFALKLLQSRFESDAELKNVLIAAGCAAQNVVHSNVARALEVHAEETPYVVMERVDGLNLQEALARSARGDIGRYIAPILIDVLNGLEALHSLHADDGASLSMVHRAPCARHIVIGYDGVARLVDLMHAIGPGLPWSARRDEFLVPSEMAPEQVLAPAHVDARCDLFIVGTVLWEALTGESLFAAEDSEATLQSMLRKSIPLPSEVGAKVGHGFDRICMRALQRSRRERYASAHEMRSELCEEAQRADLMASREEIAHWLRALCEPSRGVTQAAHRDAPRTATVRVEAPRPPEPCAAVNGVSSSPQASASNDLCSQPASEPRPGPESGIISLVEAITGVGPSTAPEVALGREPFRPNRPTLRPRAINQGAGSSATIVVQASSILSQPNAGTTMAAEPAGQVDAGLARSLAVCASASDSPAVPAAATSAAVAMVVTTHEHGQLAHDPNLPTDGEGANGLLDAPISWQGIQGSVAPPIRPVIRSVYRHALAAGVLMVMAAGGVFLGQHEESAAGTARVEASRANEPSGSASAQRDVASPSPERATSSSTLEALLRVENMARHGSPVGGSAAPSKSLVERPNAPKLASSAKKTELASSARTEQVREPKSEEAKALPIRRAVALLPPANSSQRSPKPGPMAVTRPQTYQDPLPKNPY